MTQTTTEAIARIIRGWDLPPNGQRIGPGTQRAIDDANTKAVEIAALIEQLTAERDSARQALAEIVHGRPGWREAARCASEALSP